MNPQSEDIFEHYEYATKLKAPADLSRNVLATIRTRQKKSATYLLIPISALIFSLFVSSSIFKHTQPTPSHAPAMPLFGQNPEAQIFYLPHAK